MILAYDIGLESSAFSESFSNSLFKKKTVPRCMNYSVLKILVSYAAASQEMLLRVIGIAWQRGKRSKVARVLVVPSWLVGVFATQLETGGIYRGTVLQL